jgi:hypothetical protein
MDSDSQQLNSDYQQKEGNRKKRVLRLTSAILSGFAFWFLMMAISMLFLLDVITPSRLLYMVLPPLGIFLLALSIIIVRWMVRRSDKVKRPERRRLSKRGFLIMLLILIVAFGGIGLGKFLYDSHQSRLETKLLESAREDFVVVLYGNIPQERVDRILIELERTSQRLRNCLGTSMHFSTIKVNLFADTSDYLQFTGQPSWSAGVTGCFSSGPELCIPLEKDESSFTTPEHEVMHATICEMAGSEVSSEIPRWFHEGLAEYETEGGFSKLFERDLIRFALWMNRDEIMPEDAFLSYFPNDSTEEVRVFYRSSFEFMRYIVHRFGERATWRIINRMNEGQTFDKAFVDMTGHTPDNLYSNWVNNF